MYIEEGANIPQLLNQFQGWNCSKAGTGQHKQLPSIDVTVVLVREVPVWVSPLHWSKQINSWLRVLITCHILELLLLRITQPAVCVLNVCLYLV